MGSYKVPDSRPEPKMAKIMRDKADAAQPELTPSEIHNMLKTIETVASRGEYSVRLEVDSRKLRSATNYLRSLGFVVEGMMIYASDEVYSNPIDVSWRHAE